MRFDELAFPFRVQQIDITGRCIFGVDQLGVVTHHAQRRAPGGEVALRVPELGGEALHVGRRVGAKPLLLLPEDEVRCVRRVDDIDIADRRLVFLIDALEYAFGTRALDVDLDVRIFGAKRLGHRFRNLDVDRGVPDDLALFGGGRDHRGRGLLSFCDPGESEQQGDHLQKSTASVLHRLVPRPGVACHTMSGAHGFRGFQVSLPG